MKVSKTKKILCCILAILSLTLLFAGCGAKKAEDKRAEEIAAKVLNCTKEQRDSFGVTILGKDGETSITVSDAAMELAKKEYGDYFTDDCIKTMLSNRYFLFGKLTDITTDISAKQISVTRADGKDNDFTFTAELWADEKLVGNVSGTIGFSADDLQKASVFTLEIVK